MKTILLALFLGVFAAVAHAAPAVNKVKAGELVIDPPTLINLGFEWLIEGDDNRNAKVEVSYRKHGDAAWKTAMPLLRLSGRACLPKRRRVQPENAEHVRRLDPRP